MSFDFLKLCKENNIYVPIIPRLNLNTIVKQLTLLPRGYNLYLTNELVGDLFKFKSN